MDPDPPIPRGPEAGWQAGENSLTARRSPDEDNTNFRGSSSGWAAGVSREDDAAALRHELWLVTDLEYKRALETIARKKASRAIQAAKKDKTPDFAKADAVQSVTDRSTAPTDADGAKLKTLVLELSKVFRELHAVDGSRVELVRRRLLASEKTRTDEKRSRVGISVHAETTAEDGQRLASSIDFTSTDVAGLPGLDRMRADTTPMTRA